METEKKLRLPEPILGAVCERGPAPSPTLALREHSAGFLHLPPKNAFEARVAKAGDKPNI